VSLKTKATKRGLRFLSVLNLISILALSISPFVIPQKALAAAADNYRWVEHNTGISGSDIAGIAIDPDTPTTIYALTGSKGVYKSTDGGSNWTAKNTGFPSNMAVGWAHLLGNLLTMDPNNSSVLYTNIGGKVYKSTDGAENWSESNTGITACAPNYQIAGVIVDPQDSNHLFAAHIAAGCSGGVYESTDAGANWTRTANSGISNDAWTIAIDPTDNQRLYSGTIYIGFAYSTDGGDTWTQNKPSGANSHSITVAVHPSTTSRILLGNHNGLYLSTDYGITWTSLISQVSGYIYDIRFAPSNSNIGYAVGNNGLFKTTDGGLNWSSLAHSPTGIKGIAIHPTDSNTIYLGTSGNGVYKSTDGGTNLTAINTGLPTTIKVDRTIVSDRTTNSIYAGVSGQGLCKSTDSGSTWQLLDSASTLFRIAVNGNTIFYTGTNVRRSTDGGTTWSTAYTPSSGYAYGVAIDPNNSQVSIIGTTSDKKIHKSTDGGDSWTAVGTLGGSALDIKVDPLDSNLIYIAANNDYFWKSTNGGQNWTRVTSGLTGSNTRYLTLHTDTSTTLYLTTQDAGVYKSTNQGDSWTKFSDLVSGGKIYGNVVVDYSDSNTLYVPEYRDGVYKSIDGGNSWFLMSTTGFPTVHYGPYVLCRDPADSGRLLIGFYYNGVYSYENHIPVFSTSTISVSDDNGGQVVPGDTLTYTVTVTNSGWADGNDTTLTATIPSGLTYVADSTTRDDSTVSPDPVSEGSLSLSIGDFSKDDSIEVTFQATVNSGVSSGTTIGVYGTITSDEDTEGTNTSTASVTVSEPVSVSTTAATSGGGGACDKGSPSSPTSLRGIPEPENDQVTLYWEKPSSGELTHYSLAYGEKPSKYAYGATNIGNLTSYTVSGLSSCTDYYFVVSAVNDCASSSFSNEFKVRTKCPITEIIEEERIPAETEEEKEKVKEEGYLVKVKVVDKDQQPIQGAKVTLHSEPQEAFTDENGEALFEKVEPGEHKIVIAYQNQTGEQKVNLEGEVKGFAFTVQVKPTNPFLFPLILSAFGFLFLTNIFLLFFLYTRSRVSKPKKKVTITR
jgi:uncharacterized repeat protein (TIGR01451 family)